MARNTLILVSVCLIGLFAVLYFKAQETVVVTQQRARPAALARRAPASANDDAGGAALRAGAGSVTSASGGALPSVKGVTTNADAVRRDLRREIQTLETQLEQRRRALQERSAALYQLRDEAGSAAAGSSSGGGASGTTGGVGGASGARSAGMSGGPSALASGGTGSSGSDGYDIVGDTGNGNEAAASSPQALEERAEEIRALSANLEEMRATREAIRREEEEAIKIRENANRLEIARIDTALQQAEDAQEVTRSQLERWSRDHAFVNGVPAHNPELENQMAQHQEQIQTLREQRLALASDVVVHADRVYNLSQQARDQLRSEEQDVRTQIFSLQNEIRRIQRSQVQEHMSRQSQASQVQQAQRALQSEAEAVRRLEASLQSKQQELRRLE